MIDHTAVNVSDQEAAKTFYSRALEPLGYALAFEAGEFMGFADYAAFVQDADGNNIEAVCQAPQ